MGIKLNTSGNGKIKLKAANTSGLVGYWPFSEGGGNVAHDFSGNGNHGTLVGGATWIDGGKGKALSFDSTGYISIKDDSAINFVGDFTISLWMKIKDSHTSPYLISKQKTTSPFTGYGLFVRNSSVLNIEIADTSISSIQGTTNVTDGIWKHIIFIRSGALAMVYVNGIIDITPITVRSGNTSFSIPLTIGAFSSLVQKFPGVIDDVRLYSRALPPQEVFSLYQAGSSRLKAPNNQGLVGYWPFNEGSGTVAHDMSGNGNHGAISNVIFADSTRGKTLSFKNQGDIVTIKNPSAIDAAFLSANYSISFWMLAKDLTSQKTVLSKIGTVGSGMFGPRIEARANGVMWFTISVAGNDSGIGNGTYEVNSWIHFVAIQSGSSLTLYKNGTLHRTGSTSNTYNSNLDLCFGALFSAANPENFVGQLDDIRIYSRALSPQEVSDLYNSYI